MMKYYQQKITIDGKRVTVYGKTKAELHRKVTERLEAERLKSDPMFESYAWEWYESHEKEVDPATARMYYTYTKQATEFFKIYKVSQIKPGDIQNYLTTLSADHTQAVVRQHLCVLRLIFRRAVLDEIISTNPGREVTIPKGKKNGKREAATYEDFETVKNHLDDLTGQVFFISALTGLRRSELLALQVADVDFNKMQISVNKSLLLQSGDSRLRHSGKSKSAERSVPILPPLVPILQELTKNKKPDNFLFEKDGKPYTKSAYQVRERQFQKRYGLTCTCHQFRHFFATLCYDAGLDPKQAQSLLGHSDIQITMNIYTHLRQEREQQAQDKLADFTSSELFKT